MSRHFAAAFLTILISAFAFAEGTKELRPAPADNGSLLLMPSYSLFGIYGAPPAHQLKIRVASLSETIYFGLNNKNGIDAMGVSNDNGTFVTNIPFRIVSPSGLVVYSAVIPGTGVQGNIATWNEAAAGPKQLGNAAGYNAIQVVPLETGDYIMEFNPSARGITRLNLHLFDITVADLNKTAIPGRLHSQGWQISTGSYTNPFHGKVYPYDGSSAVYQVDFNGMQPWVFVINFNSTGTGNSGIFTQDRQSKIGNHTYGEYEVFLNPPSEILYPAQKKTLALKGNVVKKDCISSDFCLDFTASSAGDLEGFIDFNNNGQYDAVLGEVFFSDQFSQPGTRCISWNGKDNQGNIITGNFQVVASLRFGITHLPLYDVEHNQNGYKVSIVRPAGSTAPVIFWDDTQITAGSALDSKTNLSGCISAISGCHRWINRGSINDPNALDRQETINTWWYSTIVNTTTLVNIPRRQKVQLSFDPVKLIDKDTTVCRGDSLKFYVYNDGTHFDLSKYSYEWFFNTAGIASDIRTQQRQIMEPSEVVVKSADKTAAGCISYDTLHIRVVDPVKLTGKVIQPTCNGTQGSIEAQMTEGPPGKRFYWQEFPTLNSGTLTSLNPGVYHLTGKDPAYSHCAADTSFTIQAPEGIIIDTLRITPLSCTVNKGNAEMVMKDNSRSYEFSWDNGTFSSINIHNALLSGSHTVAVRDVVTGCMVQRSFQIAPNPFKVTAASENEVCHNAQGSIQLALPPSATDFTISWNGISGKESSKAHLSSGLYSIHATSPSYPGCSFDTTISITSINRQLLIHALQVQPSDCRIPTGAAIITMAPGSYFYSWDNQPYSSADRIYNLSAGRHTIRIKENSGNCVTDTSFEIPGNGLASEIRWKNERCHAGNGSITILADAGSEVIWQDGSHAVVREDLSAGIYAFTIRSRQYPACKLEKVVEIKDSIYTLSADFSYQIINPDSMGRKIIGFTNLSRQYQWSYWMLGDGATSNETNPIHGYSQDQLYTIKLQVIDSNGCIGEAAKSFSPFRTSDTPCSAIALPNVFSPNHDGMNDDIGILGYAPVVELQIFNRWGEVIFRTRDISFRWDGLYRGEEAPVGVYPYILDWMCPDEGEIHKFHKVGDITLVR